MFKSGDWVKDKSGHMLIFEYDVCGKAYCRSICGNYRLLDYSEIEDDNTEERKKARAKAIRDGKRFLRNLHREKAK